jgi:hypothetical protein
MSIHICTHLPLLSEKHSPCNGKYKAILAAEINHETRNLWSLTPHSTVSENTMCKVDLTARILLSKFRHYSSIKNDIEYDQVMVEELLNKIIRITTLLMTTPTAPI